MNSSVIAAGRELATWTDQNRRFVSWGFFGGLVKMWVFPQIGGNPPKWMVKMMENPIKMGDLGGNPLFLETSM